MSTKTFSRYLISNPLLAAIAYFTIMFAGGCYAKVKEKTKEPVSVTLASSRIPVNGNIVKLPVSLEHY